MDTSEPQAQGSRGQQDDDDVAFVEKILRAADEELQAMGEGLRSARPLSPGDVFGAYRIIDKIGEGGMGVVWRRLSSPTDLSQADGCPEDPSIGLRF